MTDLTKVPRPDVWERKITHWLDQRTEIRRRGDRVPEREADLRHLLDVIAILRGDLHVAITKAAVAQAFAEAQAQCAEDLAAERGSSAKVR